MYRYFGTYLLQSSFIFLILAQKLGPMSDGLIVDNCTINLQVLDVFARVTNMEYQRVFARTLRETLLNKAPLGSPAKNPVAEQASDAPEETQQPLDPELLRYRWIAGYNGLWPTTSRNRSS
jgi:xylanolytic transcriptional activator XlnR